MEKQEIVKLFLSHGFQLSESALSLVEENPEKTLSFIQKINPRPFIITKDHLKDVYEEKEEKQTKVKLVKKFIFQKKDIRVEDYSRYFRNIYDKVKEFLLKNPKLTGLISINKITSNTKDFSLIVLVCDKGQRNLLVEDLTGETHVFFNEKNEKIFDEIDADDILGLVCTKEGENIYAKDLLYPDISITREVNKTKKEIRIFYIYKPSLLCEADFNKLSGILKQTKKTDPIFVFGEWEDG
ncbi:MAG: hypothetical protein GW780_05330, partial [Candidatus Aenigmarchaeota archaeon]|nr:hypothetical protein [Candidatus Aenigmarchaeota archaeon]